jgi:hypothetical protein
MHLYVSANDFLKVISWWVIHEYKICKIGGFHGGDYEEGCLLGWYAVWLL